MTQALRNDIMSNTTARIMILTFLVVTFIISMLLKFIILSYILMFSFGSVITIIIIKSRENLTIWLNTRGIPYDIQHKKKNSD